MVAAAGAHNHRLMRLVVVFWRASFTRKAAGWLDVALLQNRQLVVCRLQNVCGLQTGARWTGSETQKPQ